MLAIIFLLLNVIFAIFLLYLCLAFVTGAPFVPSHRRAVNAMIALSHLEPGMIMYDLGSGDGRTLFAAAKKGAMAIGFEINPILVVWTKLRILFSPLHQRIKVHWKTLWRADLRDADVVYVYLLPHRMKQLEKLLKKQLKPNSIVVSNSFIFPHWKILRKDTTNHIYVFQII